MKCKENLQNLFTNLCKKLNQEYEKTEDHYDLVILNEFSISKIQIKRASYLILLGYFIILIYLYYLLKLSLSILFFFLLLLPIIHYYFSNLHKSIIKKKEIYLINYFQFLILQMNVFFSIMENTQDRFSFIHELISNGPIIACNSKEIFKKIYFGGDLKKNLQALIFYSESFQKVFKSIIEFDFDMKLIKKIDNFNTFYEKQIDFFIKSLETRLSLFFFFSIFYPICFFLFISYNSLDFFTIIISLFLFFIIEEIIIQRVLQNNINLIGNEEQSFISNNKEFQYFLDFFNHLGQNLINLSPEMAILQSIQSISLHKRNVLKLNNYNFHIEFISIAKFFLDLSKRIKNNQISLFLEFLQRIFKFDSSQGKNFYNSVIELVNSHNNQMLEQETILKNSNLKAKIYKILLGFILGILTPFLYRFQIIFKGISSLMNSDFSILNLNGINTLFTYEFLIFISLSFTFLIIALISFNRIYISNKLYRFDYYVISLFWFFLIFSNFFLNILLY